MIYSFENYVNNYDFFLLMTISTQIKMLYKYVILNWPIKTPFFGNYVNYYEFLLLSIITFAKLKFIGDVAKKINTHFFHVAKSNFLLSKR